MAGARFGFSGFPWASPATLAGRALVQHRRAPCAVWGVGVSAWETGFEVLTEDGADGAERPGKPKSLTCGTRGPDGSRAGSAASGGAAGRRQVEAGVWLCRQVFPAPRPQHRPIWSSGCCKATGSPALPPGEAGPSPGLQTLGVTVGCTEGPHLTAYPCKNQGWGRGSEAVYKPLKLFMVPGGTLAIRRDTRQIVLAGSEAALPGSLGLRAPLRLPAFAHVDPPRTARCFLSRPSQQDGRPSGTARKPPPPGSKPWFPMQDHLLQP